MARFSVGRSDDGEGSSNHQLRKRLRLIIRDPEERVEHPNEEEEDYSHHQDRVNSEDETDSRRDGGDFETGSETEDGNSVSRSSSPYGGLPHGDENELVVSGRSYSRRLSTLSREGERIESDGERPGLSSSSYPPVNCSSPLQRCRSTDGSRRDERGAPVLVTLQDTEILDCCICYEPLTIPIFQCENGHIACAACCTKLRNKCPSCALPIGYNRCRALEKVLESARVSCPNIVYGCQEKLIYGSKSAHEKECIFSPCSCPISGCSYTGPSKKLYKHFSIKHSGSGIKFTCGCTISTTFRINEREKFLEETDSSQLFVIQKFGETIGDVLAVRSFAPPTCSDAGEFFYILVVSTEDSCLRFESKVMRIQKLNYESTLTGYVVIPTDFLDASGRVNLCISIQRRITPL